MHARKLSAPTHGKHCANVDATGYGSLSAPLGTCYHLSNAHYSCRVGLSPPAVPGEPFSRTLSPEAQRPHSAKMQLDEQFHELFWKGLSNSRYNTIVKERNSENVIKLLQSFVTITTS